MAQTVLATVPLKCNVPLARAPQMRMLEHSTIKGAWHPPHSRVSIPWGTRLTLAIEVGATPPQMATIYTLAIGSLSSARRYIWAVPY